MSKEGFCPGRFCPGVLSGRGDFVLNPRIYVNLNFLWEPELFGFLLVSVLFIDYPNVMVVSNQQLTMSYPFCLAVFTKVKLFKLQLGNVDLALKTLFSILKSVFPDKLS